MVLACAVLATGCSFVAVSDPRPMRGPAPAGAVVCESTYVAPVFDALVAIAGIALIAWGATAESDPEGHTVTGRDFAAIPGLALLVPFGFSSVYGFTKVADCKRAARRH